MAGKLYHSVGEWKPLPCNDGDLTSGRIGHVFFFPEKSFLALKDKPKGWASQFCGGLLDNDKNKPSGHSS